MISQIDRNNANESNTQHPKGSDAKILLTSVFGPYAQDDQYGSREINPMELYHNQVTRTQGPFSLRMFHRSWGLMMIQSNISAECKLLDFPVLERFIEEIKNNDYDIIGISAIAPNIGKVQKMSELIREHLPNAEIIVGGHIANIPDLAQRVDLDHVARGEGVRWMRSYLNEDTEAPVNHPIIKSGIGNRSVGVEVNAEDWAPTLIPTVGCPIGCNFCSTSAMFGGKGCHVHFYESGDQLFDVMCQIEKATGKKCFFVMDENFLLYRNRTLRLLELMEEHDKSWSLYVFGSANVLEKYTIEQLVRLGISWIWMGLEGQDSQYKKLHGIDVFELIDTLRKNGIRILGSTIIGLENHSKENIEEVIDYAVRYNTDFHQFMLYTPVPGTPLHKEATAAGLMKDESEYDYADIHGQYIFNYRHPLIKEGDETKMLLDAFNRDFNVNGPSILRVAMSTLAGWKTHKNNTNPAIKARFQREAASLASTYSALTGACKKYYRKSPELYKKISEFQKELFKEFGLKSRLASFFGGLFLLGKIKKEAKNLENGWTYEPPTFYDRNYEQSTDDGSSMCRFAIPKVEPQAADVKQSFTEEPDLI